MQVSLRSPVRKLLVLTVCLTASASYISLAVREYLAFRYAETLQNASGLRRATELSPWNAGYWWRLGTYEYFASQNARDALHAFRTATTLNPYSARSWLSIALVSQFTGDVEQQRKAIEQAALVDPRTPDVAWEAANFYLLQNNLPLAFRHFRGVIENDPERAPLAIAMCWRAAGDTQVVIDHVLPPAADRYLEFLRILISENDAQAAATVWFNLMSRKFSFNPELAFPYFQYLIDTKQPAKARESWQQLIDASPALARYRRTGANLITNGGFEEKIRNGGFDWREAPTTGITATSDTTVFNSGNRSLSVHFNGDSTDTGIYQYVDVEPNTEYTFSAAMRTDLLGAPGPRFAIADAYGPTRYAEQDDFIGLTPWRSVSSTFKTGTATTLLLVKLERPRSGPVRGTVWIDDVSLIRR